MHIDKAATHVISSILHVDHSEDSDPWPLVIEDFQGNTVEVVLEAGDMLFYESSKCFHGRPTKFNGSWYTSLFTHYKPADPEWNVSEHFLVADLILFYHFSYSYSYINDFRSLTGLFQLTMRSRLSGANLQNLLMPVIGNMN